MPAPAHDLLPPLMLAVARLDCEMSWEHENAGSRRMPYSSAVGELASEACLSAERLARSLDGRPCRAPSPRDMLTAEAPHLRFGGCSARMRAALGRLVGKPVWLRLLELGVDTGVLSPGLPWRLSGLPAPAAPAAPPDELVPVVWADPPEVYINGVSAVPVVRRATPPRPPVIGNGSMVPSPPEAGGPAAPPCPLASLVARGRPLRIPGQAGLLSPERARVFGESRGDDAWLELLMACPSPPGALDAALAGRLSERPVAALNPFDNPVFYDDGPLFFAAVRSRALANPSGALAHAVLSILVWDGPRRWGGHGTGRLLESLAIELCSCPADSSATPRRRIRA